MLTAPLEMISARTGPAPWLLIAVAAEFESVSELTWIAVPDEGLIVSAAAAPLALICGESDVGSATMVPAPPTASALVEAFQIAAEGWALSHAGWGTAERSALIS